MKYWLIESVYEYSLRAADHLQEVAYTDPIHMLTIVSSSLSEKCLSEKKPHLCDRQEGI